MGETRDGALGAAVVGGVEVMLGVEAALATDVATDGSGTDSPGCPM
jgi:hypothetical protein